MDKLRNIIKYNLSSANISKMFLWYNCLWDWSSTIHNHYLLPIIYSLNFTIYYLADHLIKSVPTKRGLATDPAEIPTAESAKPAAAWWKSEEIGNLECRMKAICQSDYLTDGEILLEDDDGTPIQRYKVHRIFFESASSVFHELFRDAQLQNAKCPQVVLANIPLPTFEQIRKYIYTDSLPPTNNLEEILLLHGKAKLFKIKGLDFELDRIINNNLLDKSSTVSVLVHANKWKSRKMMESALNVISEFTEDVFQSPGFVEMDEESFIEILKRDDLNVQKELHVFKAVKRWGEAQCEKRGWNPNEENYLETMLANLVGYVRFPTMEQSEITTDVTTSKVLSLEDMVSVLVYFTVPNDERYHVPLKFSLLPRARPVPEQVLPVFEVKMPVAVPMELYKKAVESAMFYYVQLYVLTDQENDFVRTFADYVMNDFLNKYTALIVYSNAFKLIDEERMEKIKATVCRYANYVLRTDMFLNLKEEMVIELIKRNELKIDSEVVVFQAVVRWGTRRCINRNLDAQDPGNLRQFIQNLIGYVRFTEMNPLEFETYVVNSKPVILKDEEVAGIRGYWERERKAKEEVRIIPNFELPSTFITGPRQTVPVEV